jgi:uncharacterized protein (TIGR02466 family)|tara:strand:+ start:2131 stop:2712 length:582 start_codon:yes stop_codon:yes gene_type:complete
MIIEKLFPINVGIADNPNHKDLKKLEPYIYKLSKQIKKGGNNWIANRTYNTAQTHNIFKDCKFERLNNWVDKQVTDYCNILNYKGTLNATIAWFNIYKKSDYQEYHNHPGGTLAAVYFFKSDKDSSAFHIKSYYGRDSNEFSLGDHTTYKSKEGRLLIFNSTVQHCVSPHMGEEDRISFSFNYKKINEDNSRQ